ncbi:jg26894 [Pararge aegeria aegeria]|uniref:Jg26894 protein n=1 Tax=Pararge aegeria aegeria TaxID=348720 RepID=A0A8S4SGF8_9NEOP|nr:jg26894 [Pararge aegeria aegeria]
MWAFRHMLAISWTRKVSNEEDPSSTSTIKIRKVVYLGHVLRHERYELLQLIMTGKVARRRGAAGFVTSESGLESRVQQN